MKVECRDALYDPEPLFEMFLTERGDSVSAEDRETIRAWGRKYVRGNFVVLRHLKAYTVFLNDEPSVKAYGVLGLTDDLSRFFPAYALPMFIVGVLLPYEGRIVADGLFRGYNVTIGRNMTRNMNEEYQRFKKERGVILAL